MRVSLCYISIGDCHLVGLVALDPIWSGEVVLVIRVLHAFDQPFRELLLRDGFTVVLSTVGDGELGSACCLNITGSPQVLVQSGSDRESAKCPIHLCVHRWHKDRVGNVHLRGYLGGGSSSW